MSTYRLNTVFNNYANEVDCDFDHIVTWAACVEGWYTFEVSTCDDEDGHVVIVSLCLDHPEYGWNELCYGNGRTEHEAICNFIFDGNRLDGEDWTMFHIALGRYVDKV